MCACIYRANEKADISYTKTWQGQMIIFHAALKRRIGVGMKGGVNQSRVASTSFEVLNRDQMYPFREGCAVDRHYV